MGIWGDISIIILLLLTFYYQKQKIGSLETEIKSQKGILESAETFINLFDLEKLKGYSEIMTEKVKAEKEIEINKIRTNLDEEIEKHENLKETVKYISEEFFVLLDAFFDAFFKLPSNFQKGVIEHMGKGTIKPHMEKTLKKLEEIDTDTRKEAVSKAFLEIARQKQIEGEK